MQLCKLKIGPRDPELPATFLNAKVEINGIETKVYSIDIQFKGDDPEDPIAVIELPINPEINMHVQAKVKQPKPVKPAKPPKPEIREPCSSCGCETMNRQDRISLDVQSFFNEEKETKHFCGQCGLKAQAIQLGKEKVKPASVAHGKCIEAFEDDPDEQQNQEG